jgi:hypothetical protein
MSEFKQYETQFKDKECLKAALAEKGYNVVEDHEQPQQLYDYHGRPTTYLDKTGDKAEIIVRRTYVGGAANDLGFRKQSDGTYSAIISAYDSGRHNTKWMVDLKKSYTEKVTVKEAKRLNLKPYKVSQQGGKKVLQYLVQR